MWKFARNSEPSESGAFLRRQLVVASTLAAPAQACGVPTSEFGAVARCFFTTRSANCSSQTLIAVLLFLFSGSILSCCSSLRQAFQSFVSFVSFAQAELPQPQQLQLFPEALKNAQGKAHRMAQICCVSRLSFQLFNSCQVAVITGATAGVGLEAARILAGAGCAAWASQRRAQAGRRERERCKIRDQDDAINALNWRQIVQSYTTVSFAVGAMHIHQAVM